MLNCSVLIFNKLRLLKSRIACLKVIGFELFWHIWRFFNFNVVMRWRRNRLSLIDSLKWFSSHVICSLQLNPLLIIWIHWQHHGVINAFELILGVSMGSKCCRCIEWRVFCLRWKGVLQVLRALNDKGWKLFKIDALLWFGVWFVIISLGAVSSLNLSTQISISQ